MADYRDRLEHGKHYKPITVASYLVPVRYAYRLANMGDTARAVIKAPRRSMMHVKEAIPESDTLVLIRWVDEHLTLKERVIVRLMVYLGLREVEISRLDVGDFYLEDDTWWLRIWGKGRPGKDDRMPVQNGLLTIMQEFMETLKDYKPGHPMIFGKRGRMHPSTISQLVTGIMRQSGVETSRQ